MLENLKSEGLGTGDWNNGDLEKGKEGKEGKKGRKVLSAVRCPLYAVAMRHGFLFIDKPAGITSHDCVARVRRALSERDVGHLGTLDPAATGLLVLAVGAKALKVIELFMGLPKEYEASIRLGAVSSTFDRAGVIEEWSPVPGWQEPDLLAVRRLIEERFLGSIRQVPPAHSAIKVGGERAYRKARQGRNVPLPERTVDITACEILEYTYPLLRLRIACGSGTYIRSLANDIGALLRCGGYLQALTRTKVGEWQVEEALEPVKVAWPHVIPLKDVLAPRPRVDLTEQEAEDVRCGRNIDHTVAPDTIGWFQDLPVAILTPAKTEANKAHARKVL